MTLSLKSITNAVSSIGSSVSNKAVIIGLAIAVSSVFGFLSLKATQRSELATYQAQQAQARVATLTDSLKIVYASRDSATAIAAKADSGRQVSVAKLAQAEAHLTAKLAPLHNDAIAAAGDSVTVPKVSLEDALASCQTTITAANVVISRDSAEIEDLHGALALDDDALALRTRQDSALTAENAAIRKSTSDAFIRDMPKLALAGTALVILGHIIWR